jgi:hypothetical protein
MGHGDNLNPRVGQADSTDGVDCMHRGVRPTMACGMLTDWPESSLGPG